MKKEVKSVYQCMYLVSENVYNKLLDCIDEAQKDEITEMNSSFMKDNTNLTKQNTLIPTPSPATNSLSENSVIDKSLISNAAERNDTQMVNDVTQQNTTENIDFETSGKNFHQSTPKREIPTKFQDEKEQNIDLTPPSPKKSRNALKRQRKKLKVKFAESGSSLLDITDKDIAQSYKNESEKSTVEKKSPNNSFQAEFKCIYCKRKFKDFPSLKSHIFDDNHTKKYPLNCLLCDEEVSSRTHIQHFNTHKNDIQKGEGVKKRLVKNKKIQKPFCFYPEW